MLKNQKSENCNLRGTGLLKGHKPSTQKLRVQHQRYEEGLWIGECLTS